MKIIERDQLTAEQKIQQCEYYVRRLIYDAINWGKGDTDYGTAVVLKGTLDESRDQYELLKEGLMDKRSREIRSEYFNATFHADIDRYTEWYGNGRPEPYKEIYGYLTGVKKLIAPYIVLEDSRPSKEAELSVQPEGLSMVTQALQSLFELRELKAINDYAIFSSAIRTAAWIELIYNNNYLGTPPKNKKGGVNLNRKLCKEFACKRYGASEDIKNSFESSKRKDRQKHVNNAVDSNPPLKNIFND